MPKVVSLFTGIGGLDFGFEAAGFDTAVCLELDSAACNTLRLNRNWPVIEGDIHEIPSSKILDTGGLDVGETDVLIGGPPCQPFSKSSYWVNGDSLRLDDPRADTLTAYLRVVRDLQPKTFLLENVLGLAYKGKDEGLALLLRGIEEINKETGLNYKVTWKALNAAHYGVPQLRERVFLVGSRDGLDFSFPMQTHFSDKETMLNPSLMPYKTAWDALGDLGEPTDEHSLKVGGKWGDLLPSIPEGENYLWHTDRNDGEPLFGWRTRYWSFLLKLSKRLPSWTIQAQPGSAIGPFHWNNRKLSARELCRIQTFPDNIQFECSRTDIQKMVGNAVPSLLSEVLAHEIRRQFLDKEYQPPKKPNLLPPKRTNVPMEEKIKAVPSKYHDLRGNHKPHPGTKKKEKQAGQLALALQN